MKYLWVILKKYSRIAPYNDVDSYQIDTFLAKQLGFKFSNINSWIDSLIKEYIKEIERNYQVNKLCKKTIMVTGNRWHRRKNM